ncbi:hypothetical protein AA103196_2857 [Ameyamaea chiangmaiensis NBRC 103196]|uniref:Bax inhibitor-1/YccA family protein n=1 Tax=Ameyamaea chiangmaiensis TaxID=442969 RepID=A0A850PDE6_9PROT|nr:Bax inhibitor-1/YccA family protein [Ameyamaea chiangmaiensis]MBS4074346.1 Bax inhibitor-1/YccA family protein [Ameyamaea chiangmaiensis]NVN40306.1 Bax inhibitor-1/YccA family protein [Ameyamaea chiangmaiensis]GBQ71722.1 hypothetical protein AA103196_2857 [Ameyamaea chiangmaiensis NBRC 103196]
MAFSPDFRSNARTGSMGYAGSLDAGLRAYMLRVYNWMASGLALTGIIALLVANTSLQEVFFHRFATGMGVAVRPTLLGMVAIFAPLAFVLVMSFGVNRLSRQAVQSLFWAFCCAMGVSMANIFMIYTGTSIARVFFIAAGMFAGMSLWGYTTQRSLVGFGSFLMMGLIGLVIAGVVNIFLRSTGLAFLASIVGVFVFTGLAAFDTQRIKLTYQQFAYYEGPEGAAKRSVYDALALYLNFINLFQFLLSFMGVRNNSEN